jgi:cell division protein FtsW
MTAPAASTRLAGRAQRSRPAQAKASASNPLLARPLASYYLVLGTTALLVTLGLVMVLSASSVESYSTFGSSFSIVDKQAMWLAIGLPCMWVASRIPPRAWRFLGYPLLLFSLLLVVAVLVPGVGHSAGGATRWIQLPMGLQVQPSEPAKLALVLWGADLLARKEKLLGDWKHVVIPLVPGTLLLVGLVVLEPDLGTAVVLIAILFALLWVAGVPGRTFSGLGAVMTSLVGLLAIVEPYRLARLTSFTNPFKNASTTGYQAVHGIYALASGGWFGVGLGASREKWAYLPNAYTDYIFAIIGEELGLVGTVAVLTLFAMLGYAGIRIAIRSTDRFVQIAAAGITAWLLCQALVNIGSVLGLLPVTGIPLPLVSFGGSALVPTLAALGILLSFARREPGAAEALVTRRRGPLTRAGARLTTALVGDRPRGHARVHVHRGRGARRSPARRDRSRTAGGRGPRRSR